MGSWDELMPGRNGESYYTGTGFPRVFYLGYHLYKQYFPLLALTTYTRAMEREASDASLSRGWTQVQIRGATDGSTNFLRRGR